MTSQDLGDTFRVSLKADLNPINTNTDGEAQELETGKTHFLTDFLTGTLASPTECHASIGIT